jgi:hypothetical protein
MFQTISNATFSVDTFFFIRYVGRIPLARQTYKHSIFCYTEKKKKNNFN